MGNSGDDVCNPCFLRAGNTKVLPWPEDKYMVLRPAGVERIPHGQGQLAKQQQVARSR